MERQLIAAHLLLHSLRPTDSEINEVLDSFNSSTGIREGASSSSVGPAHKKRKKTWELA